MTVKNVRLTILEIANDLNRIILHYYKEKYIEEYIII